MHGAAPCAALRDKFFYALAPIVGVSRGHMFKLLLTHEGRINRAKFWLAALLYIVITVVVGAAFAVLWSIFPGEIGEDGTFHVEGAAALPHLALGFGYIAFSLWSGICVGIKRFHDRGKSGWWVLIQLVPVIGALWYFIEAGCLRGTVGDNRFGPDPLAGSAGAGA